MVKCACCPIRLKLDLLSAIPFWEESIDIVDFLHEDNYQGKIASETTTLG